MFSLMIPFDLVLFDFDGLLVDTEALHCKAYVKLCQNHGCRLDWDVAQFYALAHFDAKGIEKTLYRQFPELYKEEPRWSVLYEEKKQIYQKLLEDGALRLMPGVEPLLKALQDADIRRCVVTNSTLRQVNQIKNSLPVLQTIPLWITREDYVEPKPSPECYQIALSKLAQPGDRVIGFEDSMRGLTALQKAGVEGVLICPPDHPQLVNTKIPHYDSFEEYFNANKT